MSDVKDLEDGLLMVQVRNGSSEAFAELYRRYQKPASCYARKLTSSADDAADVVSDVFLRMYRLLRDGRGPTGDLAPYFTRMLRNAAYDRGRSARRVVLTDEVELLGGSEEFDDPVVAEQDRQVVARAFRTLPERWQRVLWLTTVEECPIEDAAREMGMAPNALTSLAYRAREGLRRAYLQAHVPETDVPACREVTAQLGAYLSGGARAAVRAAVEWHLGSCEGCRHVVDELRPIAEQVHERAGSHLVRLARRPAA